MPFYIAKTPDGYIEDIVLAKNKEFAHTYWQGKGIYVYEVEERNESDIDGHITGVIPILTTRKENLSYQGMTDREFILVSKEN